MFSRQLIITSWLLVSLLAVSTRLIGAESISCLQCHRATSDVAIHAIFNTAHGAALGNGDASCVACHGNSVPHSNSPANTAPDVSFGPRWPAEAEARSSRCLGCHEQGLQILWAGSEHQQEQLSCDACHVLHRQPDATQQTKNSLRQCLSCHPRTRSEARLPSHHPILEGKTVCTDCHNPHGSLADSELLQMSVNDNCYSCHQDKRGPFLWEHPPAAEDCTTCHRSHGSVNAPLLTVRGPALCQQCHAVAFHPSLPYGAQGLPGVTPNQNLLGKNCLNCHSQIHGSNHPSGARLAR